MFFAIFLFFITVHSCHFILFLLTFEIFFELKIIFIVVFACNNVSLCYVTKEISNYEIMECLYVET